MPAYESEGGDRAGRRQIVLSLLFLILAATTLYLPGHVQEEVASSLRSSVLYPFIATQRAVADTRIRATRMEELQAQLDSAVASVSAHRTLAHENRQLRSLLGLREIAGPAFVPATVVRPGTRGSESMLLLNVGSADGVAVNDPVVSAEGLVGIVREVRGRSAIAMDWTHPDFRVSGMAVDGEVFGIVEPRRGSFREEDRLMLSGTPFHAELADSSLVVTSGRGSVYPRGITVGRVHSLAEAEAGWRKSYWILPAVRPASVTHVLVMTDSEAESPDDVLHLFTEEEAVDEEGEDSEIGGEEGAGEGGGGAEGDSQSESEDVGGGG